MAAAARSPSVIGPASERRYASRRRLASHAGLSHRDCLPLRRFWAAVLSARGGVLLIGNIKGPARPGRIRCDSEPPTDPAALIGLPSPSQAFCARTLPLAGLRARPMRAGRRQTSIVCIAASSAPGPIRGPYPLMGFRRPSSADGPVISPACIHLPAASKTACGRRRPFSVLERLTPRRSDGS
jgi:hypothetical protein